MAGTLFKMKELGAIILAGGQSTRMGRDKASLMLGNQTLLERVLWVVSPLVSSTVIMLNQNQKLPIVAESLPENCGFGRDSIPERGPLQGIADALPLFPKSVDLIYVLTCDLPYLTTKLLKEMQFEMGEKTEVVHAVDEKIKNPLLALYRKDVLMGSGEILTNEHHHRPIKLWKNRDIVGLAAPRDNLLAYKDVNHLQDFENISSHLEDKPV